MTEKQLSALMTELADRLCDKGFKMACAESCTGGWLAKAATDLAGSSGWFDRGLVSYSNQAKQDLLGVSESTLAHYGAVSEETVTEMVNGLLLIEAVSIGVAISGIAGPAGGTAEKPLGTVWIAWKMRNRPSISQCFLFSGGRTEVRLQATIAAVSGLIDLLKTEH
ncbi:MAG: nicotinamide-nucleotide amidohydrolase family protein [Gammaproteobacteria bacterium]|nr:nicotinamide-nucleotide amidohydrolase family protein [Gammaproteobacteria bacterium]